MSDPKNRPEHDENSVEEESLEEMAEKMQVPSATAAGSIKFPAREKEPKPPQKPEEK